MEGRSLVTKHAIGILATGSYLPKEEVASAEVAKLVGVDPGWIERKTRIGARRYAAPGEATSDLPSRAAASALEQGGIDPASIDYLIVATSTGDYPQPPTSCLVQNALGADRAGCFDINAVCSGFIYALALARGLVAQAPAARVLVVAADLYSRILDFSDRRTAVLFGDGAGAAVVGTLPDGYGILDVSLANHGDRHRLIRAGYRLDEIDHFVPHQANGVLLDELVARSGLSGARTARTLERYGNVGSASVPVTLDEASRAGRLCAGDIVLLAGFGGGMSVGACLMRWSAPASREER
jgi:acetoacetyl-CoA synthase